MDDISPEMLVHIYDEIAESKVRLRRNEYEDFIRKWGVDQQRAAGVCSGADRNGDGYITRNELCKSLKCWPDGLDTLEDVKILKSDMPEKKRESIIWLILDCAKRRMRKGDLVTEIKNRIETVYGNCWNVFVSDGKIWSMYAHLPGSNLVFASKGIVYGVFQCPNVK